MNVACKELCEELYAVSGWDDTEGELSPKGHYWPRGEFLKFHTGSMELPVPAYDLGYLLRKLPRYIDKTRLTIQPTNEDQWCASYDYKNGNSTRDCFADTPEDAVAKLCIALFKEGILK